jgi:hypothetical protein
MNRPAGATSPGFGSFPYARGDEPDTKARMEDSRKFSLRTWG